MRKLNKENGVTLVELLAAIAILSIIVTGFLGFFIQAAKTNQHTNAVNEATFLAQEQMEEIIHNAPARPTNLEPDKNGYDIKVNITTTDETDLEKVTVSVSEGGTVRAKMETRLSFEE